MFKIIKKPDLTLKQKILLQVLSILGALVAAGIVMAIIGYNPAKVYFEIVRGSLSTIYRLRGTCNKAIPLIIFSSLVNDEMRRKGEQLGADAQLTKPEIGQLVDAIDRLIEQSSK